MGGQRVVVLLVDGVEVVVGELTRRRPDLAVVDALARLQLLVRRFGGSVTLRDPDDGLAGLLDLVGLSECFGLGPQWLHETQR